MLSAWRLRAEREEGLAGHLSASAQRAAALCGAGAAMALHPFKLWGKDTVEGCVGPVVFFFFCCCSHNCWSWTAFKNLHCQVGSFSRWTTALLSLSLVLRYADISRKHTHTEYLINVCHPPTLSLYFQLPLIILFVWLWGFFALYLWRKAQLLSVNVSTTGFWIKSSGGA